MQFISLIQTIHQNMQHLLFHLITGKKASSSSGKRNPNRLAIFFFFEQWWHWYLWLIDINKKQTMTNTSYLAWWWWLYMKVVISHSTINKWTKDPFGWMNLDYLEQKIIIIIIIIRLKCHIHCNHILSLFYWPVCLYDLYIHIIWSTSIHH